MFKQKIQNDQMATVIMVTAVIGILGAITSYL